MSIQMSPYLGLQGKCEEAMTFYKSILGGELYVMHVSETPIASQCPASMQNQVMHSSLTGDSFVLMATDMQHPDMPKTVTNGISLNFDSEDRIRSCFEKFSEGGKVMDTLKDTFWGALFGVVQDKYGTVWMFNYDKQKK